MPDTTVTRPASLRLQQLQDSLAAGDAEALTTFWEEVIAVGTPMVERLPDEPTTCLVTFLWRETEPIENVVVVEHFEDYDPTLRSKQMAKLEGSDVWYRTIRMRSDLRGSYQLLLNDTFLNLRHDPEGGARFERMQRDPLNPNGLLPDHEVQGDVGDWANDSALVLPDAPTLPGLRISFDVPHGEVIETTFTSEIMGNERTLWVHLPADFAASQMRHRLLLQFDGDWCIGILDLPWQIDALLAEGAIPPLVTVMIDNPDRDVELPCNPAFADFLADELIPHLRQTYRIVDGPQAVIAAGQSYGGLAAAWVALKRPDVIGNAFCQSGSFWWWNGHENETESPTLGKVSEHAWLPGYVARQPKVAVRFWLEAGVMEDTTRGRAPSLLTCHRYMRDVLLAKGYDVAYREYPAGHDFHVWRGLYPDGLIHLTSDARKE